MNNSEYLQQIEEAEAYIRQRLNSEQERELESSTGIVLGSGLGMLGEKIKEDAIIIPYKDIPHWAQSTAAGHKGNLIIGKLGGKRVVAMQGRLHYYEGHSMQEVTLPIRVMALLGVKKLIVSNASGAINPHFRVGDLMVITDHINFLPNPLVGANLERFGERFPDMTTVYSQRIRKIAEEEANEMGLQLQHGVYIAGTGPSYETPAEYRMFGVWGADAVGMSTVPEVIVARHSGIEIFGISVITNQSNELSEEVLNSGADVIREGEKATKVLTELIERVIGRI